MLILLYLSLMDFSLMQISFLCFLLFRPTISKCYSNLNHHSWIRKRIYRDGSKNFLQVFHTPWCLHYELCILFRDLFKSVTRVDLRYQLVLQIHWTIFLQFDSYQKFKLSFLFKMYKPLLFHCFWFTYSFFFLCLKVLNDLRNVKILHKSNVKNGQTWVFFYLPTSMHKSLKQTFPNRNCNPLRCVFFYSE